MNLDGKLLSRLEELSNIRLTDEERLEMTDSLEEIIAYAELLGTLDFKDAAEQSEDEALTLRPDCAVKNEDAAELLENARKTRDGCFVTHKTV